MIFQILHTGIERIFCTTHKRLGFTRPVKIGGKAADLILGSWVRSWSLGWIASFILEKSVVLLPAAAMLVCLCGRYYDYG